jgi:hypothetical protein
MWGLDELYETAIDIAPALAAILRVDPLKTLSLFGWFVAIPSFFRRGGGTLSRCSRSQ